METLANIGIGLVWDSKNQEYRAYRFDKNTNRAIGGVSWSVSWAAAKKLVEQGAAEYVGGQ